MLDRTGGHGVWRGCGRGGVGGFLRAEKAGAREGCDLGRFVHGCVPAGILLL